MRRKQDTRTIKFKKYKARLNLDGYRMETGRYSDETKIYYPVVKWNSIIFVLALVCLIGWSTTHIDYVLEFPQAPVDRDVYMRIPKVMDLVIYNKFKSIVQWKPNDYLLRVHRNLYGSKVSGGVCNDYLTKKLIQKVGFCQSKIDPCVFYKGKTLLLLYTDDSILIGPDQNDINDIIKDIKKENLDITVEGDIQYFLGINIEKNIKVTITFSQPHIIDHILKYIRLYE